MRTALARTSAGRIMTAMIHEHVRSTESTRQWIDAAGQRTVRYEGDFPVAVDGAQPLDFGAGSPETRHQGWGGGGKGLGKGFAEPTYRPVSQGE